MISLLTSVAPIALGFFAKLFAMKQHANQEQQKLMIWWVDKRDPNYVASQNCTNWGILNRFIGTITANLVVKRNPNMTQKTDSTNSVYTSGFDFI